MWLESKLVSICSCKLLLVNKETYNINQAKYLDLILNDNPEKLEASYGKLVPVLVRAIQELKQ